MPAKSARKATSCASGVIAGLDCLSPHYDRAMDGLHALAFYVGDQVIMDIDHAPADLHVGGADPQLPPAPQGRDAHAQRAGRLVLVEEIVEFHWHDTLAAACLRSAMPFRD